MILTQNTLVQLGFNNHQAVSVIHKLEALGAKSKIQKQINHYMRNGKSIETIVFVKTIKIESAIKALAIYCAKTPYSSRVNIDKWMGVMQMLKSLKERSAA